MISAIDQDIYRLFRGNSQQKGGKNLYFMRLLCCCYGVLYLGNWGISSSFSSESNSFQCVKYWAISKTWPRHPRHKTFLSKFLWSMFVQPEFLSVVEKKQFYITLDILSEVLGVSGLWVLCSALLGLVVTELTLLLTS